MFSQYVRGALSAMGLSLFLGCGPADDVQPEPEVEEGLGGEMQEAVSGTTSICGQIGSTTFRFDGAAILTGSNTNNADGVVVTNGASQHPSRGGQKVFVESGGSFFDDGSGAHRLFVNSGGRAKLDGGGGHVAYIDSNGSMDCSGDSLSKLVRESGSRLTACYGATSGTVHPFRRCSRTTAVEAVWPTVKCTATRSGNTVTFRNTSTGTFNAAEWTIIKYDGFNFTVVARSTARSGFSTNLAPFGSVYSNTFYYANLRLTGPLPEESLNCAFIN
jgi:hypothetical protein